MTETKELLAALITVRNAGGNDQHGICCAIAAGVNDLENAWKMLEKLFVKWPKFSGNPNYPINGGARAYNKAKSSTALWDRNTDYGILRWELLEWLIEELQK